MKMKKWWCANLAKKRIINIVGTKITVAIQMIDVLKVVGIAINKSTHSMTTGETVTLTLAKRPVNANVGIGEVMCGRVVM